MFFLLSLNSIITSGNNIPKLRLNPLCRAWQIEALTQLSQGQIKTRGRRLNVSLQSILNRHNFTHEHTHAQSFIPIGNSLSDIRNRHILNEEFYIGSTQSGISMKIQVNMFNANVMDVQCFVNKQLKQRKISPQYWEHSPPTTKLKHISLYKGEHCLDHD